MEQIHFQIACGSDVAAVPWIAHAVEGYRRLTGVGEVIAIKSGYRWVGERSRVRLSGVLLVRRLLFLRVSIFAERFVPIRARHAPCVRLRAASLGRRHSNSSFRAMGELFNDGRSAYQSRLISESKWEYTFV